MRNLRDALLLSLIAAPLALPAMAQTPTYQALQPNPPAAGGVPADANPATGARPGNVIGTGQSMPLSSSASNINGTDTRSDIAPRLPTPDVGNDSPDGYLRAARGALMANKSGEAQQALEMAETRLLDRSVAPSQANDPIHGPRISDINAALQAMAAGDTGRAIGAIDTALRR